MTEPEFVAFDVVLFMHDQALREYGGAQGAQKDDLLHSALARPMNKLAHEDTGSIDLFDLAAAYAYGLVSNHAFTDANKRTAWSVCSLFLKLNGVRIEAPVPEIIETVVGLAARQVSEAEFAAWLRSHKVV